MIDFASKKSFKTIFGKKMAYIEEGEGDPIVFLHGNPTSSFLWRDVMPELRGRGRLIAPDLIGTGDSEKLENTNIGSYSFREHKKYLFELLEQLGVEERVTLVIHDWGSALGMHWAHSHEERLKGIAFMEGIFAEAPSLDAMPNAFAEFLRGIRSPQGEEMILQDNMFVEGILPSSILRKLSDDEMNEYRRPYKVAGEDRRPTLTWPRQIPIAGHPQEVSEIVKAYGQWAAQSDVPKLFVNAEPGALVRGPVRDFVRSWPNVDEVTVKGIHFIQEDSGKEIGQAIANWLP